MVRLSLVNGLVREITANSVTAMLSGGLGETLYDK